MPAPNSGAGGGTLTPGVSPPLQGPGDRRIGPGLPGYGPTLPVPGPGYICPLIMTPGPGPNGPLGIDARKAVASVGEGSSVPYGATNGYATTGGMTGFVGPAAGSLRQPILWYVRATGSNNNGGSSNTAAAERSGSDGVTNNTTTFTSATAAFTSADVNKGICINTGANARHHRIASVTNATTVILDRVSSNASGLAWAIGGAWADPRVPAGDVAVNADTNSPVRTGDTVYIGGGTYRAVVTVGVTPSFNGYLNFVGDVTGQFTGDAGAALLTAYVTNDKTAPSGSSTFTFSNKSNFLFQNLMFVGGTAANTTISSTGTSTSQNVSFLDCAFLAMASQNGMVGIVCSNITGLQANWLFDRCYLMGRSALIGVTGAQSTILGSYDLNSNVVIRNSLLFAGLSGNFNAIAQLGANSVGGKVGGVLVRNCTVVSAGSGTGVNASTLASSTIFPMQVYDSIVISGTALNATASGELVEDYNILSAGTPRTLVTAGAHSISDSSYSLLFHFGQERIWLPPMFRAFMEPMAGSPQLNFGNDGGQTPYDLRGATNPRPAGGAGFLPAVGALERADTFIADPAPIGSGGSPTKLTGPGYNDFLLPIANGQANIARTVSVKVKFDANYAGVLPQMELIAKPQQGVAAQTVTAVGTAGNVLTISLASFTPTAGGVLNIRLLSNDLSGVSVVEWDDFTIT